jgi:hypothetical protein
MPNDKQNRQKLNILVDQVYKHAKKHSLEVFSMYSGDDGEQIKMSGNYSVNMVRNVVYHMLVNHPEEFAQVIETVNQLTKQNEEALAEESKEIEEQKPMSVV